MKYLFLIFCICMQVLLFCFVIFFSSVLESLRQLYPALDALYDRLDDRQKEILDLLATPAGHDDGDFAHQAAG